MLDKIKELLEQTIILKEQAALLRERNRLLREEAARIKAEIGINKIELRAVRENISMLLPQYNKTQNSPLI